MRKSLLLTAVLSTLALPTYSFADEAAAPAAAEAAPAAAPAPAEATPAAAPAAAAAAPAPPALNTGMNFPLTANANPISFDAGPIGKVYVSGALTGLGFWQSNSVTGNKSSYADISNAQLFVQKVDGPIQFYLQGGGYSIPSIGYPYLRSGSTTKDTFGVLPQAFIKYAPTDSFSIQAGKLPTLIGAEYTWTFENTNIERGLLWGQENAVNRGVQANYTKGPLALSASVNDGFYSKEYNWLSGMAAYTINDSNSITVSGGGNLGTTRTSTIATPFYQNNGQVYNLIYKNTTGPWTFQPYLQYSYVPSSASIGINKSSSTYGVALLANYAVNPTFSIGARGEYIGSSGSATDGSLNLLGYGAGSNAWSLTITPTYQVKTFFVRGELSYVHASSTTAGDVFDKSGNNNSQSRAMIETGFLF